VNLCCDSVVSVYDFYNENIKANNSEGVCRPIFNFFIHGSNNLHAHISLLTIVMQGHGGAPQTANDIITKGNDTDLTSSDNYRTISLDSTLT
jgi:hypothetical protein